MPNGTHPDVRRQAGWLPEQEDLEAWLAGTCERVASQPDDAPLAPAVQDFSDLLDAEPVLRMQVEQMIEQVPAGKEYEQRHLTSVPQLLRLLSEVLSIAPEFGSESVTTPLGAILDWTMGTPAGFAVYRDPRMNEGLRRILDAWSAFLSGPDSRYVLNDSEQGWLGERAKEVVGLDQFEHDPDAPYAGFGSWNEFFTRRFKEGVRPVAAPDDDGVITNGCESTPYRIATGVQRTDDFWIKREPYSLHDMLAGDPSVDAFVGGTVYQAFLSATNYHRWHSPVRGTIRRAFVQPGTYYSEADSQGAAAVEPMNSQGYLAHVATRAILVIDADDPRIGEVAVVQIGMSDVSSCLIREGIEPGRHVEKGEELGMFQFGGSTWCLVLRPGVVDTIAVGAVPMPGNPEPPVLPLNTTLFTVARS